MSKVLGGYPDLWTANTTTTRWFGRARELPKRRGMKRLLFTLICLTGLGALGGCDMVPIGREKQKVESKDDDDDRPKKKKKSKEKADQPDEPKALAVDFIGNGFVVPAGGVFKANRMDLGDRQIEIKNYSYGPLEKFPRAKLREDFKKNLEANGWKVVEESNGYRCSKAGKEVTVLFGEAGAEDTKINFM